MIEIKPGKTEYAQQLCDLVKASITHLCEQDHKNDHVELKKWLANKTQTNMESWLLANQSYCAISSYRDIVGFSMISPGNEILLNYVAPEYARQGVGKLLMEAIENDLTEGSVIRVNSTKSAILFYQQQGFTAVGCDPRELQKTVERC